MEGREDGVWKEYYPDGKISFEGEFLDGQETGVHKFYWPNGKLHEERVYRLGLPDGTWKLFDESGVQVVTITYRNGEEIKAEGIDLPRGEGGE